MSVFKRFLVPCVYLLMVLTAQKVDAIKCYVCQSKIDPKCADPFDNLTLPITDCNAYPRADLAPKTDLDIISERGFLAAFGLQPPVKPLQASMCRKIRQKANGEWRTIRECGYLGPPGDSAEGAQEGCQMRYGAHDVFMEVCTCNTKDGCNSAGDSKPSAMLLLALCSASLLFLRRQRARSISISGALR